MSLIRSPEPSLTGLVRPVRGGGAPHEGAAPDLAGDEAAFRGQRIGTADRADGDAQAISQVALRREARALRQAPVGDLLG